MYRRGFCFSRSGLIDARTNMLSHHSYVAYIPAGYPSHYKGTFWALAFFSLHSGWHWWNPLVGSIQERFRYESSKNQCKFHSWRIGWRLPRRIFIYWHSGAKFLESCWSGSFNHWNFWLLCGGDLIDGCKDADGAECATWELFDQECPTCTFKLATECPFRRWGGCMQRVKLDKVKEM
jgi:hypothetical protein